MKRKTRNTVDANRQNRQVNQEDHQADEKATFPGLPVQDQRDSRPRARARLYRDLRVCRPHRNGGIGTFCLSLATTLAEAGHQVTILYLSRDDANESGAVATELQRQDPGSGRRAGS
jgi:hypothetical protein